MPTAEPAPASHVVVAETPDPAPLPAEPPSPAEPAAAQDTAPSDGLARLLARESEPEALPDRPDLPWLTLGEEGEAGPEVDGSALVAALPARARELVSEDFGGDVPVQPTTSLGGDGSWSIAHQRWGAVETSLVVVDAAGRVRGKVHFFDRVPEVGLVDLWGDETLEVIVEVIEGTAMSSYPRTWRIYGVTPQGKLRRAGTLAKAYNYGSKTLRHYFRNTVTMPAKGTLRVETTTFEERGPNPPKGAPRAEGEVFELRYQPAKGTWRRVRVPSGG
jgi:hypothetical protein